MSPIQIIRSLSRGDSIRLFEIDGRAFNMDEVLFFHGYNVPIQQRKSPPVAMK